MRRMLGLLKDRRGATAIEYALIAAFVAMAVIAALTSMGGTLREHYVWISNAL